MLGLAVEDLIVLRLMVLDMFSFFQHKSAFNRKGGSDITTTLLSTSW